MLTATIVIPCFRAESTLEACLSSLIGQNASFPFEVVVVENGSPDESLVIAERIAARSAGRLRVVSEPKAGSYAARNRGLEEAKGAIVAFTDADCRADPEWLARMVAALDDPAVLLVGGEILGEDAPQSLLARYASQAGILSQRGAFEHPRGPFFQTANMAVRREDARSLGGFDETLYSGGDAAFCWNLSDRFEGRFEFVEDARIHHAHRESLGGLFRQFRRYGQADVCLTQRFGLRARPALVKLAADAVRVVFLPLFALTGLARGAVRRDLVPVVAPWLRVVRVVGRRVGQISAFLFPRRLHRT